jgi:hypothetical protein
MTGAEVQRTPVNVTHARLKSGRGPSGNRHADGPQERPERQLVTVTNRSNRPLAAVRDFLIERPASSSHRPFAGVKRKIDGRSKQFIGDTEDGTAAKLPRLVRTSIVA